MNVLRYRGSLLVVHCIPFWTGLTHLILHDDLLTVGQSRWPFGSPVAV